MIKVAIVGANSYIARNLFFLMSKNSEYSIKLYDRDENHFDGGSDYTQIDVMSEEQLKKIDFNCEIMFVFIGKTGTADGFDNYTTFINVNEIGLLNLLKCHRNNNSKAKIVFPSTRLIYKGAGYPLGEDAEKEFKTVYAVNKFACEQYLKQYSEAFGLDYCIFRICVPYGSLIPGVSSYGTAEFMLNKARSGENIVLYGNGSVRRTVTYIGDLCSVMLEGALSDRCLNDAYNIGGEDYSLAEIAGLIAAKYNVGVEFTEYPEMSRLIESGSTVFDDSKLNKAVGYRCATSMKQWLDEN